MKCRHCAAAVALPFMDLGTAPPSNAYVSVQALSGPETYYPLRVLVCTRCWLVQTEDFAAADELFSADYAYFSSVSKSWLAHAAAYCQMIAAKLELNRHSLVMEVAANDGYLLKNFVAAGIPCLGIEPTASTAAAAEQLGIPIVREFFGRELATRLVNERGHADLIIGNNVYAHVPDINDFTAGLKIALEPGGTITLEFPHLLRLISQVQFDTLYHEHFSYLCLQSVSTIFAAHGLRVWDVEELTTHGGSLRVYGCHAEDPREMRASVARVLGEERSHGLFDERTYTAFQARANEVKYGLLEFLLEQRRLGKTVAAYGAAAKGNTLLNFAGVRPDLVSFVCDAAPSKQGRYLPGSRIPIVAPTVIADRTPDYLLILPWNIADEVMQQCRHIRQWGGRFVVAVPELRIIEP
jgi:hypothetical protein